MLTNRRRSPRLPTAVGLLEEATTTEVVFTRMGSIAEVIERLVRGSKTSVDAALYRFNSQRLARVLDEVRRRGVRIRLIIDRNKYEESMATRRLLMNGDFRFRLAYGRDGAGSKMHHKFVLLDEKVVLTGSYNWTFASEQRNYENLLILREPKMVDVYLPEFEALWSDAEEPPKRTGGP